MLPYVGSYKLNVTILRSLRHSGVWEAQPQSPHFLLIYCFSICVWLLWLHLLLSCPLKSGDRGWGFYFLGVLLHTVATPFLRSAVLESLNSMQPCVFRTQALPLPIIFSLTPLLVGTAALFQEYISIFQLIFFENRVSCRMWLFITDDEKMTRNDYSLILGVTSPSDKETTPTTPSLQDNFHKK